MALPQSAFALARYYCAFVRLEENGYWCFFFFQVFYRPMLKFNVMSKQYINQLFPNLDELIKIHGKWT